MKKPDIPPSLYHLMNPDHNISQIKDFLTSQGLPSNIDCAVILGSGLGGFGDEILDKTEIPYESIPGFPQSTVAGHSGALLFGTIADKTVLAFSGRFHHYEGYPFSTTIIPVQLAQAFNVEKLIISNAAGGINFGFSVGDLMVIDNVMHPHIDIPIATNDNWLEELKANAQSISLRAKELSVTTKSGTYLFVNGPNYETKSEILAFRTLGGDAVGMSTAPELMEAYRLGINAVAISLITNAAAGVTDQKLDHAEVKEAAELKKEEFARLVTGLINS